MSRKSTGIYPTVTDEKKRELLVGWIPIVEAECAEILAKKDEEMAQYNKMKSMYDSWLFRRMRRINKFEKRLMSRRDQLKEIQTKLDSLNVVPEINS
jgi:hypothetical protein